MLCFSGVLWFRSKGKGEFDGAQKMIIDIINNSIKRENLSTDAYKEMITFGNSKEGNKTHCEVILGLPGDTKEKHF